MRVLKRYGPNLDNSPTAGKILRLVAKHGFLGCVRLLVQDYGVDPRQGALGRDTLMLAAMSGHEAVVRFLLEQGHCEIKARDKYRKSAADLAASNGHLPVLHAMASRLPTDEYQALIRIAQLRQAAIDGDADLVSHLLDSGIPPDLSDMDSYSPLLHAVQNGKVEVVRMLLTRAGDRIEINRQCPSHCPYLTWAHALAIAIVNEFEDIVKLLLQRDEIEVLGKLAVQLPGQNKSGLITVTPLELASHLGLRGIETLLRNHKVR